MIADDTRSRRPDPPGVMEVAEGEWEPWAAPGPSRGRMNRLAVVAFVFGLLGGLLGPIFGVVALFQIKRTGERGRGLAIAGSVLFGVWALVAVLLLTVVAPRPDPEGGVRGLRVGDCFRVDDDTPTGTRTAPEEVTTVPCTAPHDGELVDSLPAYERYADEEYPGAAALSARAETACRQQQRSYVLDPLSLPVDVRLRWYVPSRVEWRTYPQITCYLAGSVPLTRQLRQDATVVRPEQLAYLMAAREFDEARAALAAQGATASPAELHSLVERTASANAAFWLALSGATWPAHVKEPMEKLIAEAQEAAAYWREAEKTTDRAQTLGLVAQAEQRRDPQTELAVRRALGLSTVQGEPAR